MPESRSIFESKLSKSETYSKCLSKAQKLGLNVTQSVTEQIIRVEEQNRSPAWWAAVIFGFLFYIIPGILVLIYWKPYDHCELTFHDSDEEGYSTSVVGKFKGDLGRDAYNQLSSGF